MLALLSSISLAIMAFEAPEQYLNLDSATYFITLEML